MDRGGGVVSEDEEREVERRHRATALVANAREALAGTRGPKMLFAKEKRDYKADFERHAAEIRAGRAETSEEGS